LSYDKGEYTTTFSEFEKLLQDLYDRGYRLISMSDYLNNNISVPAGCIPIIFTFDDGTSGQFNLVEENGTLKVNKKSAVGIMEEFYLATALLRVRELCNRGFNIWLTKDLKLGTSAQKIQEEIAKNQRTIAELIPGYKMTTFSA